MNTLKELYKADTYRYVGKLEFCIRFFIFFIVNLQYLLSSHKTAYKALFHFWANRSGLELTAN